jgi:hypothetical protein
MNLIAALLSRPLNFVGQGTNHEGEIFVGRLEIQSLVNGSSLLLQYTATRTDGKHLHKEATLLGTSHSNELCLWPVMEELPFVLPHPEVSNTRNDDGTLVAVFASGPREATECFREEITIEARANGELRYAHSWGMPGGAFEARSSCLLSPADV